MMKNYFIITLFFISCISVVFSANAKTPCDPKDASLSILPESIEKCLYYTRTILKRHGKADEKYVVEFLETLLPITDEGLKKINHIKGFEINYNQISEIISMLKSKKLIKRYIDFIIFTENSADERRDIGLGQLYILQAPDFLNIISAYTKSDQDIIIKNLAWGLANNYYLHLNSNNYHRLIVGEYWEVIDEQHPNRALSKQIENAVYSIVRTNKN